MRFTKQALFAALAQAYFALAQENAFNVPTDFSATAGQSLTLNWDPTTTGTVSLILRSGASSALTAGTYIAQSIANSGSYTWNLPSDITRGSDYAVEIVDDTDPTNTNFSPYFVIESTNTVASSTSDIALGAATTSISGSTVASTASSTAATTGSSASSSLSSVLSSVSSSLSSSAASASSSISSLASSLSSASSSSAASGSASSSSRTTSAASSSSSAAASSASESASPISTGGAAIATAMPALMGVLALGAMVL